MAETFVTFNHPETCMYLESTYLKVLEFELLDIIRNPRDPPPPRITVKLCNPAQRTGTVPLKDDTWESSAKRDKRSDLDYSGIGKAHAASVRSVLDARRSNEQVPCWLTWTFLASNSSASPFCLQSGSARRQPFEP